MREDERDRVARQGTQAWVRLKREKNYMDWLKVGEALQVGRELAMNQAGTNKPEGKGYNIAFGEWLTKYKMDDMDKSDRSRLFEVMEKLPAIEQWRQTLTLTERMKLNHPNAVLRKWKAHTQPPKPKGDKPTLRDNVISLEEENATLKAHVAELEASREVDASTPPSSANKNPLIDLSFGQIVDLILELPKHKREAVVHDLVAETKAKPESVEEPEAEPVKEPKPKKAKAKAKAEPNEPETTHDPKSLTWEQDANNNLVAKLTKGEYRLKPVNQPDGAYTVTFVRDDKEPKSLKYGKTLDDAKAIVVRHLNKEGWVSNIRQ